MVELPLETQKIAGRPDQKTTCGVFNRGIALADGTVGTLVGCVLISEFRQDDSQYLADIFEIAVKKLEIAQIPPVLDALRLAGGSVKDHLKNDRYQFNLVLALFYKNTCYLLRFGKKVKIVIFDSSKSIEINFEDGSGPLAPGQIYLIATEELISILDTRQLLKEGVDLAEIMDGLATEISTKENQGQMAAIFVRAKNIETPTESDDRVGGDLPQEASEQMVEGAPGVRGVGSFLKVLARELGRLRRGDVRAMLRLRRNLAVLALLVVLVLVASTTWTIRQQDQREKLRSFNTHYSVASSKYQEGVAIVQLNRLRARELLIEADRQIKIALEIKSDSQEASRLASDITAKLKETEGAGGVKFEVVFAGDWPFNSLAVFGKQSVGITSSKVVVIDVGDKSTSIEEVSLARSGYVYDNKAFILTDGGVFRIDLKNRDTSEIIKESKGLDIAVFLGNVYLLELNGILKFVPIEGGYSDASSYLNEKNEFGESARFAIDGSIWVSSEDSIFNFLRGERQDFSISGLTSEPGSFSAIYTNAGLENLYVIDKANSTLLVIGKDGIYKKSYQGAEFSKAADLVVDETETKIYLVVDNRLLSADLE